MWYAFIPDNQNLQDQFIGYTNNPYIIKAYTKTMNEMNVQNALPEGTSFETIEKCLECIQYLRDRMHGIIHYSTNLPAPFLAQRNKLFSIHGRGINRDILVVNDVIYENFYELFFTSEEMTKLLHDLNRLCNQLSTRYMYQYLTDDSDDIVLIKKLVVRLYEYWKEINKEYQNYGLYAFMMPSNQGDGMVFNYTFDETFQLRFFMASEIAKFNWGGESRLLNSGF